MNKTESFLIGSFNLLNELIH